MVAKQMATGRLFIDLPKTTAYSGPPSETVHGGHIVQCPNGHHAASLTRGFDPKKEDYYLRAFCNTCKATKTVFDKERNAR